MAEKGTKPGVVDYWQTLNSANKLAQVRHDTPLQRLRERCVEEGDFGPLSELIKESKERVATENDS